MGTQTQTPPSATATPSDETFELMLDEPLEPGDDTPAGGDEPEVTSPVSEPNAPPATHVAEVPAEPPAVEPKKGDLDKALKEERRKRKELRGKWQQVLADRDRLLGELGRGRPTGPVTVDPTRLAALKDKAEKVGGFGEHAELILGEVQTLLGTVSQQYADLLYRERLARQEELVRFQHTDFDRVLEQAKIWDGLQLINGQYKDPAIAKAIYDAPNPSAKAYELATAKLAFEAGEDEDEDQPSSPTPPPAPPPTVKSTKPQPSAAVEVEHPEAAAERRGAKQVVDKMLAHANKPHGVRTLRDAGAPRTQQVTRRQLDDLANRNHEQFLKVMQGNPELERWYYS